MTTKEFVFASLFVEKHKEMEKSGNPCTDGNCIEEAYRYAEECAEEFGRLLEEERPRGEDKNEWHKRDGEIYIGGVDILPEITILPHKSKRVTMALAKGRVEELELAILRKVAEHYGGRTIENIIQNYEQIIKERDEQNKKKYLQETHI